MSTDFYPFTNFPAPKRFRIRIPIKGSHGQLMGMVDIHVIATSARQARAHARKEMIKIARRGTNEAEIVDESPREYGYER